MIWNAMALWWHHSKKKFLKKKGITVMSQEYLGGLMQERRNSSALAVELHLSCINPSICSFYNLVTDQSIFYFTFNRCQQLYTLPTNWQNFFYHWLPLVWVIKRYQPYKIFRTESSVDSANRFFISGVKACCMVKRSHPMMTSSNGNIFHVTGHLCGEFTGHGWIPCTKATDVELWCFIWFAPQ